MNTIIKYKQFFVFTEDAGKYFHTHFNDGVNIICGANTSGKSTVLQAINYTFGINDETYKLNEILAEKPIFRIDIEITKESTEKVIIIRDQEFIYIKRDDKPIVKFSGISGNKSEEHKSLKAYISEMFNFSMRVESNGSNVNAPIEAIFLPYYIAQDYGWVIALKSFRGFEFYKKFKEAYYDYYLGIENESEVEDKYILEQEKKALKTEADMLSKAHEQKKELKSSLLNDDENVEYATKYIDEFKANQEKLIGVEREFIVLSNKIKLLEERQKILRKLTIKLSEKKCYNIQCPTCKQNISQNIESIYNTYQGLADNESQLNDINTQIKNLTGEYNSIQKKMNELRSGIAEGFAVFSQHSENHISINSWIKNKVNVELFDVIQRRKGEIQIRLEKIDNALKTYRTDMDVIKERVIKSYAFNSNFTNNIQQLNINTFGEKYQLYKLPLFPQQGVELLKTLLSYHFAFNATICKTRTIHRLPFCLDAIFKEDVDQKSKEDILQFISNNKPTDTQLICSIAESDSSANIITDFNRRFFNNKAKLIQTGESKRSLLKMFDRTFMFLLKESIEIMTE